MPRSVPGACKVDELNSWSRKLYPYLFSLQLHFQSCMPPVSPMAANPDSSSSNEVRGYHRISSFWLPYRDESFADVKVHDRRGFGVEHQQYVINPANASRNGTDGIDRTSPTLFFFKLVCRKDRAIDNSPSTAGSLYEVHFPKNGKKICSFSG